MTKILLVAIFVINIIIPNIANSFSLVPYDFEQAMIKYRYPDKVYKTQEIIESEMKNYGTNLKSFQVQIGEKPDGFLDKKVFIAWQKWKKFKAETYYRDNHPYSTPDQGNIRIITKPLRIKKGQREFIFALESYNNDVIIAFNLKKHPNFAKFGIVRYGYENSNTILYEHLKPIKGLKNYYMARISLPYNKKMYFQLIKFGIDYESFSKYLPFTIPYKKLEKRKIINQKVGRKFYGEKCQVIFRENNRIKFLKQKEDM